MTAVPASPLHQPIEIPEGIYRRVSVVVLGLIMVAAFFLPVNVREPVRTVENPYSYDYGSRRPQTVEKWVNPNWKVLQDDKAPGSVKFVAVFPAVAGTVLILMGVFWRPDVPRGAVMLILLALFAAAGASMVAEADAKHPFLEDIPEELVTILLAGLACWLGISGMLAGARAVYWRPGQSAGSMAAILGGIVYVLATLVLIVTAFGLGESLGIDHTSPQVREMTQRLWSTRIAAGLSALCVLGALLMGFLNTPRQNRPASRPLAAATTWLLAIGTGLWCLAGLLLLGGGELPRGAGWFLLKVILSGVSIQLLLAFGLADILIGKPLPPAPAPATAPAAAAPPPADLPTDINPWGDDTPVGGSPK